MKENELKYLHEQISYLQSVIKSYSDMNIIAFKNQNSEYQLTKSTTQEDISEIEKLIALFHFKPAKKQYHENPFIRKANNSLRKLTLIEDINHTLLSYNNPVLIYQNENVYSNETIISKVAHDFVINGKEIHNCHQLYLMICEQIKLNPYSDLSNINPPKKTIVIIENYNDMMKQLSNQDKQVQEWLCHLRNTMENTEPLLFVLLNADSEDDTFMRMGELVSRLIPFYN